MSKSLRNQINKITFADIELSSNLSEKSSKQIATFINDKFEIVDFNVNYSEDFNVLTISLSEEKIYNISIVIFNDIKGKTILKLTVDNNSFENALVKNIRVCNLTEELDNLYNDMLSSNIAY